MSWSKKYMTKSQKTPGLHDMKNDEYGIRVLVHPRTRYQYPVCMDYGIARRPSAVALTSIPINDCVILV